MSLPTVIENPDLDNPKALGEWARDQLKEDIFRSKMIKEQLHLISPDAVHKIRDILSLSVEDEKTVSVQLNASKFILETLLVDAPSVSLQNIVSEHTEHSDVNRHVEVTITREELQDFAAIALSTEASVRKRKEASIDAELVPDNTD